MDILAYEKRKNSHALNLLLLGGGFELCCWLSAVVCSWCYRCWCRDIPRKENTWFIWIKQGAEVDTVWETCWECYRFYFGLRSESKEAHKTHISVFALFSCFLRSLKVPEVSGLGRERSLSLTLTLSSLAGKY